MNILTDLWAVLTNRLSMARLIEAREIADHHYMRRMTAEQECHQLKRDMQIAQAGIRDLKSKLPKDYELVQRAESDKLSETIIEDMQHNPSKYLP